MAYWKLGCNWGTGNPDFYKLLKKYSIVICGGHNMKKGDYVALTQGHNVIALAQLTSDRIKSISLPELQTDFASYKIDYADCNYVAYANIWVIPEKDRFLYRLQQGICQIQSIDIQEKIRSLIGIIMGKKVIDDCTKLLLGNYNIILTGAPGTGKTYLAKEIAKAMGATDRTCKLVQFHPSYDYTDFVEGLRPIKDIDNKLGFERKDGVFKAFCKEANNSSFTDAELAMEQFKKDIKGQVVEIPYKDSPNKVPFTLTVDNNNKFRIQISNDNGNLQSATDEDVISSINTDAIVKNKTFAFCIGAYIKERYMNNKPYVFIIDEINRGEISKIFGELFYSIDCGYRGAKGRVNTQYQNLVPKDDVFYNGFYIPKNVFIIGTMNDIDRSVESIDFAMRRRFAWKEITAESRQSILDDEMAWCGTKPAQEIIDEIKIRMNKLNACIIDESVGEDIPQKDKIGLTKAYQIGASYFLKLGLYNNNFDYLWANHLKGLLYEYLRGTTNIEGKIDRLHKAYNNE